MLGACKRHCDCPAARTPAPGVVSLVCEARVPVLLVVGTDEPLDETVILLPDVTVLDAGCVLAEATDEGGTLVDVSLVVETDTLKLLMTRLALPVKGSVPVWTAWRYCVPRTPCWPMRYSDCVVNP